MVEIEANSAEFVRQCEELFFIIIALVITAVLLLLTVSVVIDKLIKYINEVRTVQNSGLTRIL